MKDLHDIAETLESDLSLRKTLNDGTGVVVDLKSSRVLALNATGMFLIERIAEGADSIGDLTAALTAEFEVDAATAQRDVLDLVEQLRQRLGPDGG